MFSERSELALNAIADYVLRLICGSTLCALILSVSGSGKLLKSLCGLYLAFLAISPLRTLDPEELFLPDPWFSMEAQRLAWQGQLQSRETFCEIISGEYRAYILSRAAELSLTPEVTVQVDSETGLITHVQLTAQATPYEKNVLTDLIRQNLGVERSSIHWSP